MSTIERDLVFAEQVNKLYKWLVATMREIEFRQNVSLKRLPEDLLVWWQQHKDSEERRKREEAEQARRDEIIKNKALAKLTDYEKKLLGLLDS